MKSESIPKTLKVTKKSIIEGVVGRGLGGEAATGCFEGRAVVTRTGAADEGLGLGIVDGMGVGAAVGAVGAIVGDNEGDAVTGSIGVIFSK